jgi:amino acid adenylation domain-containing protein
MNTPAIEGYQLSPQQKRLWLLEHAVHNMPCCARCAVLLKGNLDIPALRLALQSTISRHEILRTTFRTVSGMSVPLQVIDDATRIWLDYADIPHLEDQFSQYDFETMLPYIEQQASGQEMSDLATAKLYTLGDALHVLFLNMPGLWLDQKSIECMVSELARCYQVHAALETDEPVQYAAVAHWLNELLAAQDSREGQEYWCDRLVVERPHIPFFHATSPIESFQPQRLRTIIAPTISEKIVAFTDGSEAAVQSFLLSCLNVLLWHLTERESVVVGAAYDGRTEIELQDVLGPLTRYVPIVTHLEPGNTCMDIMKQVREVMQAAEEWLDYFDWSNCSQRGGKEATLDYFPICFEFHNESEEHTAGDITCTIIDSLVYSDLFDLRLSCTRTKRGLIVDYHYNNAVCSSNDVERFAAYFARVVEGAASAIEARIESLEILGETEQRTLLCDLARSKQTVLKHECIPHEFEEQVKRTPHNIALALQGNELTYAELNGQANRLAYQLKRLNVQPETMIALCAERSLEAIIGLLGILKAGGVCVPLDPVYPDDRQQFILEDSQSPIVVTQEKFADRFARYGLEVVSLDMGGALREEENVLSEIAPEQLAYVIYTSGSTGKPKGVGVSHQAALNHFITMRHEFHLNEYDRVLQFASLSFDVSLEQIFPALFCGATIFMRGPTSWSVTELNKAIVKHRLTVVNLTPAFWQQWVQEIQTDPLVVRGTRLRLVIVGGEAMTQEALRSWRKTPLAKQRLLNAYGPTEAVITATVFEVPEQFSEDGAGNTVPIGRPLANREIYILNRNGQLAARGIPGELYIGGELLARGYLNRPDQTAERFIPNPFSSYAGARLYRTGDLGRYLLDGSIEYLGRIDQQVKIRGFRIEPGEIEAALQKHPGVQTAIVVVREDDPGEKRLVAYVLLQKEYQGTLDDLRSFLAEKLPEYMLPSVFIGLDTLPLTPNGKVDRRMLPVPDASRPEMEGKFVAPRNTTEEALAKIWSEVLKVHQIGIHDNFFKLGGHSLAATQVIVRIQKTFQIELPVHVLFQEPTIAGLAGKITEAKEADDGLIIPAITRIRRDI